MGYSPWYLRSESKKFFIHKDEVHSTMRKEQALTFSNWNNAFTFAEDKGYSQIFTPIQNKDIK